MCELVLLLIPIVKGYENAQVMCSSRDSYTRSCEFGAEVVISTSSDSLLRAIDIKGGYGGMMRGLLGQKRDSDFLATEGSSFAVLRGNARGTARWCAIWVFELEGGIFDVPIALIVLAGPFQQGGQN